MTCFCHLWHIYSILIFNIVLLFYIFSRTISIIFNNQFITQPVMPEEVFFRFQILILMCFGFILSAGERGSFHRCHQRSSSDRVEGSLHRYKVRTLSLHHTFNTCLSFSASETSCVLLFRCIKTYEVEFSKDESLFKRINHRDTIFTHFTYSPGMNLAWFWKSHVFRHWYTFTSVCVFL